MGAGMARRELVRSGTSLAYPGAHAHQDQPGVREYDVTATDQAGDGSN